MGAWERRVASGGGGGGGNGAQAGRQRKRAWHMHTSRVQTSGLLSVLPLLSVALAAEGEAEEWRRWWRCGMTVRRPLTAVPVAGLEAARARSGGGGGGVA